MPSSFLRRPPARPRARPWVPPTKAAAPVVDSGAISLTGAGSMSVTGLVIVIAVPSFSGSGSMTATAVVYERNPASTPTPVPTAAQVEDALSGRYGPVSLRFRYTRRTRTNDFIDDLDGVL